MENYSYDVLDIDKHLCFHIYATSREIIKIYRPYLEPLDLTYTQYITMMVLWKEKQLNVKELGIKLFLDSGT
ncbi:MAG: transcriptional regulator, partial [Clostridia bacterium]|nr:transcriptional regulator [Clostridia bacterium]